MLETIIPSSPAIAAGLWTSGHGPGGLPLAVAFLNPGFAIAGAALIALPILIHILNRRRFRTMPWAAMEYLLAAMKKNRRRLKFEQWMLLAVRCCVVALLGLALARPLGCADSSLAGVGQRIGLHILIIDNSYSMAYEADRPDARTHLDQARHIARSLVDRLGGEEAVVVITAGSPAEAIIDAPAYELESVKAAIDRIEQRHGGTDLAGALRLAAGIAADAGMPRRSLHLITDGTRSAFEGRGAANLPALIQPLAAEFTLHHHHLGKPGQWNHAVLSLDPATSLVTSRFDSDFRAVVRGFGSGPETLVQWRLDDQILPGGAMLNLDLDTPTQSRSTAFSEGGTHVVGVSVISDDRLKLDNARSHVVAVASELKTLIVEGYRGNSALEGSAAFLNLALAPPHEAGGAAATVGRSNSYVSTEVISDIQLGNKVLADYRAVILTNVSQFSDAVADQLQHYVRGGGTLLLFMGDQVNSEAYNRVLLPRRLLPGPLVRQVNTAADQPGYQFDFIPSNVGSNYLKVFENQPSSGLDTARIYTYVQLALPADSPAERVLDFRADAAQTTGDPAITVHGLGEGRVIFYASSADPQWTSFPAKPAYVVLMHELLAGSVDGGDAWMNLEVGQPLVIPRGVKLTAAPRLTDAAQREVPLSAAVDEPAVAYRSDTVERPGLYRLETGAGALPIAVNPPAEEADVRILEHGAIRAALGDVQINLVGDGPVLVDVESEDSRDFGWIILAALLLFAGFESFLAMRFGHYRR